MPKPKPRQWLLVILAPSRKDPEYAAFRHELNSRPMDLLEHDILVMEALEEGRSHVDGTEIDATAADSVRRRFKAQPGQFGIVLADKDGVVVFESRKAVSLDELIGVIHNAPRTV